MRRIVEMNAVARVVCRRYEPQSVGGGYVGIEVYGMASIAVFYLP